MGPKILYNACIPYGALSDMSYHVVVGMTLFRNIILEKVKADDIISILPEYQNMWWQKWDGGFCISIGTRHECCFVVHASLLYFSNNEIYYRVFKELTISTVKLMKLVVTEVGLEI